MGALTTNIKALEEKAVVGLFVSELASFPKSALKLHSIQQPSIDANQLALMVTVN